jgi:hypothetical protein
VLLEVSNANSFEIHDNQHISKLMIVHKIHQSGLVILCLLELFEEYLFPSRFET